MGKPLVVTCENCLVKRYWTEKKCPVCGRMLVEEEKKSEGDK